MPPPALLPVGAVVRDRVLFELGRELPGGGVPDRRVLGQPPPEQVAQRVRHHLQRHRLHQVLVPQRRDVLRPLLPFLERPVRRPPPDRLEQHACRRVHVGRRPRPFLRPQLGRHVSGSPRRHARLLGVHHDAEVAQLAGAVGLDQDVVRADVPVGHALLVRGGQGQQRALEHGQRRLGPGPAVLGQQRAQGDAVHQFHDHGRPGGGLDVFVQAHHVGVVDLDELVGVRPEAVHELGVPAQGGVQVLDRHVRARGLVGGEEHAAGAAGAELAYFTVTRNQVLPP